MAYKLNAVGQVHFKHKTSGGLHASLPQPKPGRVEAHYPEYEWAQALDAAGVFGLVAADQIIAMPDRPDLLPPLSDRMRECSAKRSEPARVCWTVP